jgi:hypothetical protein
MPGKSTSRGPAARKSASTKRAVSAVEKASKKAKKAAREQIVPIDEMSEWVEGILPHAVVVRKPSGAMYQAGTKIFAFTRPDGIAMKLPEERVAALVENRENASFLVMGTKTMREWLMLRYNSPSDYRKDGKLFEEAMKFVASLKK